MSAGLDAEKHQTASLLSGSETVSSTEMHRDRIVVLTANAVIVFKVSALISSGIKARIKLGTLPKYMSTIPVSRFDSYELI